MQVFKCVVFFGGLGNTAFHGGWIQFVSASDPGPVDELDDDEDAPLEESLSEFLSPSSLPSLTSLSLLLESSCTMASFALADFRFGQHLRRFGALG